MSRTKYDGLRKRCDCSQWSKCSHPWHFFFHHAGVDHRLSLGKLAIARGELAPTSLTEAEQWRDRLRIEIRSGKNPEVRDVPAPDLTVGDVVDRYVERYLGKRETEDSPIYESRFVRAKTALQADGQLRIARACEVPAANGTTIRFEQKPIGSVTKADIESIRESRRPRGVVGCNRLLARLRHFWNWAISEGFAERTPFKREGVSVVKLEMRAERPRARWLEPGDEGRLLSAAGPHLRSLIVAALTTGCRVGELLSLQWKQIVYDDKGVPRAIGLTAEKTKTDSARVIPIGPRLRAELAMREQGPDGKKLEPDAYVFGDETGGRIKTVKRAWERAVLVAHGHKPRYVKGRPGQLTAECRAALRSINLHFHDLRRQFACTLLESSADLHDVRDFLGHANITTTSRYLASSPFRLARALARIDPEPDAIRTEFAQTEKPAEPATEQAAGKSVN